MQEFWLSLDSFEKLMWGIAIPATIAFILQAAMTFFGMDAGDGLEADLSGSEDSSSPFQLFSLRNLVNFFLGFSWMAISLYKYTDNTSIIMLVSTLAGVFLVAIVMYMFFYMSRMEQSGNIEAKDTIGLTGAVYIPIEGDRKRAGKIQLTVHGAVREYDALTEGGSLRTGEIIIVERVIEGNILMVRKV